MKIQRQPLRTPQGWDANDAAFVMQLERILDDVYKYIAALKDRIEKLERRIEEE